LSSDFVLQQPVIAPLCHRGKLCFPTLAWLARSMDDQLIALHTQLYFTGEACLFQQMAGNANRTRIANIYYLERIVFPKAKPPLIIIL
jgi:hypothetical protein